MMLWLSDGLVNLFIFPSTNSGSELLWVGDLLGIISDLVSCSGANICLF